MFVLFKRWLKTLINTIFYQPKYQTIGKLHDNFSNCGIYYPTHDDAKYYKGVMKRKQILLSTSGVVNSIRPWYYYVADMASIEVSMKCGWSQIQFGQVEGVVVGHYVLFVFLLLLPQIRPMVSLR